MSERVSLKIRPDPSLRDPDASKIPHHPLLENEPIAVLGNERNPPVISTDSATINSSSCFGPRGAALMGVGGPLWVCDSGHHRLLGWDTFPITDKADAKWVIGQQDMISEGRNGKASVTSSSLNVPTGICKCEYGMAVADAWNHRILIWNELPLQDNTPADMVIGQSDFNSNQPNRGQSQATYNSLYWPYGVAWLDNKLVVSDSHNRRVLIWNDLPKHLNQSADIVLGQIDFGQNAENAGGNPNMMSMRWPHSVTLWQDYFCVSDAGNNRIMVWKTIPDHHGQPCDYILGQNDKSLVDHNQSLYWPRQNTLNMPYAVAAIDDWLVVADTANSRLVGWHIDDLETGAPARYLAGQHNFHDKGDNRWQPASADSFCWPYGITVQDDLLVVADSGNNRISIWNFNR